MVKPEIRPAEPGDCAELSSIARAAKAHWGYPSSWLAEWETALTVTPEDLARFRVLVAEVEEGELAGFVAVDLEPREDALLEHLWVDPPAMGRGLGRSLVAAVLRMARGAGKMALLIESDPHAVGFYEQMGAYRVGEVAAPVLGEPRQLPLLRIDL